MTDFINWFWNRSTFNTVYEERCRFCGRSCGRSWFSPRTVRVTGDVNHCCYSAGMRVCMRATTVTLDVFLDQKLNNNSLSTDSMWNKHANGKEFSLIGLVANTSQWLLELVTARAFSPLTGVADADISNVHFCSNTNRQNHLFYHYNRYIYTTSWAPACGSSSLNHNASLFFYLNIQSQSSTTDETLYFISTDNSRNWTLETLSHLVISCFPPNTAAKFELCWGKVDFCGRLTFGGNKKGRQHEACDVPTMKDCLSSTWMQLNLHRAEWAEWK